MLRKNKLLIGLSSGAITLSSIVTPISVSLANSNFINAYEQYFKFDDENGFNERWFEQFANSFENTIVSQVIEASSKTQQWKDIQIQHLKQRIQLYRNKIDDLKQEDSTKTMAYTVVSNAMIDDAYDSYVDDFGKHVKIYRSTRQNITFDDITTLYEQQKRSIVANMENAGIDGSIVQRLKEDSQKQFDTLYRQLVEQYADPLAAMYKAKTKLAMLFAAANKEIGFIGASQALSDFLSNHSIEFNSNGQNNQLDTLMNSPGKFDEETKQLVKFEKGNDISAFINDIFTIKNNITGRFVNFSKLTVVPGFKVYPVLNEIKIDKYSNEHTIEIDWRCVKDCYVGEEGEADATAHLYAPGADAFEQRYSEGGSDISVNKMFNNDDAVMMTYDIPLTNATEIANFKEAYLGESQSSNRFSVAGLEFSWDEADKCSFDPFVSGTIVEADENDNKVTVDVDAKGLAQSGLRVRAFGEDNVESQWYRLDDILAPDGYEGCDEHHQSRTTQFNDDIDDEITKTAIHKFIKNCSLKGICTFDKSLAQHNVDVQLCAWYSNTQGKTDDEREATKIEIGNFHLENLPFTKVLYHDLTFKYNAIRSEVEQYATCSVINPLYISLSDENTSRIVSMCLTIGLSALSTGLMFVPVLRPSYKVILGAYIVLTAADIAVAGTSYGIWKNKIYKPVDEMHSRVLSFSKTSLCQELMDEINQDGKKYKLINATRNKGGILEIKKDKYDENFEKNFKTLTGEINYDDLIAFNKKYSSFDSFPRMDEFFDAQDEAKICSWDIKEVCENGSDNSSYGKEVKVLDLIATSITLAELAVTLIDIGIATAMAIKRWMAHRTWVRLFRQSMASTSYTARQAAQTEATCIAFRRMKKSPSFLPTKLSPISDVAEEGANAVEEIYHPFLDSVEQELHTTSYMSEQLVKEDVAIERTVKKMFIKDINPNATFKELSSPENFDKYLSLGVKETRVNPRYVEDDDHNLFRFLVHHGKVYEIAPVYLTLANYRLVQVPEKLATKVLFSQRFQEGAAKINMVILNGVKENVGAITRSGERELSNIFWRAVWNDLVSSAARQGMHSTGAKFFTDVLSVELHKAGKCIETMTGSQLARIFDKATEQMAQRIAQGGDKMTLEGAIMFNRAFESGIRCIAIRTFYRTLNSKTALFRFVAK